MHGTEAINGAPIEYDTDVVILGTGIGGTILAAILARHGVSVTLIEKGQHPRFALGESMILETSEMLRITAARYDVPEIAYLSTVQSTSYQVSSNCGVKKNFGFLYHRPGKQQLASESTQIPIPKTPYGYELHLYRQDTDAYMLAVAMKYGARVKQRTEAMEIDFHSDRVEVETSRGDRIRARFLVDSCGFGSPLAKKFDLRHKEPKCHTHSRAIFAHLVGVKPYHDFGHSQAELGLPSKLAEGTLHHIFNGGWAWMIPFNNRPTSTNPLCSVGLNLDTRTNPKNGLSGNEEWAQFLDRYPHIAPHFEDAVPMWDWISTPRLQYTSKQVVGDRWAILSQTAGAVDAMFSRGNYSTCASVDAIAEGVLEGMKDGDFSRARFQHVEDIVFQALEYNDLIASGCYNAFKDFELWNAWYRVYGMGAFLESLRLTRAYVKYQTTGDMEYMKVLHHCPFLTLGGGIEAYDEYFRTGWEFVRQAHAQAISPKEAVKKLYELHDTVDFIPPMLDIKNPNRRYLSDVSMPGLTKLFFWGKTGAPKYMKDLYFDYQYPDLLKELVRWKDFVQRRSPPTAYHG